MLVAAAFLSAASPVAVATAQQSAAAIANAEEIVVTGARTEGSDDYTIPGQSTATRLPITIRATPQSISAVTRAQIEDFQLNDVNSLLNTVTGVTTQFIDTDRVYYSARGFDIQTFQIDGIGVPFAFGVQTGSIDTAVYDHIEVVRGAPGLLSSTGNPSAVVNFVRKRPARTLSATANAQYGSYDALRLQGDVNVPLVQDGSIRARGVGVFVDEDSYLDRKHLRRWTGYGIVEADLGPDTVISAGYGHQDHRSRGALWGSVPQLYSDGTRIDLPRSANTAPEWAGWGVIDRQIFGDITHSFGDGWVARFSAIRRATSERDELYYVYSYPDRVTGLGLLQYPGAFKAQTRNLTLEGYVTGPVTLFGRDHDVMLGLNRSAQQYRQFSSYDNAAIGAAPPLQDLLNGVAPRPNFPANYDLSLDRHTTRETAYGLIRLNLSDALKLMIGGNYTHAVSEGFAYGVETNFNNRRFLPFVGAVYDLTPNISAYASFATIFNPQIETDIDNRVLAPIKGDNLEAGLKGEWFDGRLNATATVFQTRQDNTAQAAGFANGRTISIGVDARSQGIELDIGGQFAPGLQVSGGYTVMRVDGENGDPVRTFVPRNTGRLNVSYSPPSLDRLKVGAAVQYQSRIYVASTPAPGVSTRLTQGSYAIVDLLASYKLTDQISLAANLRNLTNAKYLTGITYDAGFYGAPRTILGTVTLRY